MRSADRVRKCLLLGVDRTYRGHRESDASDPKLMPLSGSTWPRPRGALLILKTLHTIAFACGMSVFLLMAADRERALREAISAAARAIELDSTDALGYALRGYCVLLDAQLDRYSEAIEDARLAHKFNPNDMFVLGLLVWAELAVGEHERAIEHAHQI